MFNLTFDFNPIFQMAINNNNSKPNHSTNIKVKVSKKRAVWKKTSETIFGHKCAKIGVGDNVEYSIFGKNGSIYKFDDEYLIAAFNNHYIANKQNLGPNGYKLKKGEETTVKFHKSDIKKYLDLIDVTKTYPSQIRLANKK